MWGRIVFGTDGSPAATRAGEVAATIARATSAKLIATSGYRASSVGAEECPWRDTRISVTTEECPRICTDVSARADLAASSRI